jgi:hypothetical protein
MLRKCSSGLLADSPSGLRAAAALLSVAFRIRTSHPAAACGMMFQLCSSAMSLS